jgi:sigma-E factor negative regulatory protein RseC
MMEASGTVVAVEGEWVWVETESRSACSHCGRGSCSTSLIAKWAGARPHRLRLLNRLQLRPGQQVVLGIPDQVLVAASLRAYLSPLFAMLGAAALAAMLGLGDPVQALAALAGLVGGLALTAKAASSRPTCDRFAPLLLRVAGTEIDSTALTRNQT